MLPYKARLLARGFEEENLVEIRKDLPTCCKENFRVLLLLIIASKWKIHSLNIKSALKKRKKIDREVYLRPPAEAGASKL